jgi:hypothetical protein
VFSEKAELQKPTFVDHDDIINDVSTESCINSIALEMRHRIQSISNIVFAEAETD